MKVLMVESSKLPYEVEIADSLESLQIAVGGDIQVVYPFEDPVALICNEDGKSIGLPLNRALTDAEDNVYDIIAGNFLIVGLSEDNFASLPDELMKKYNKQFWCPEKFVHVGGKIIALKQQVPIEENQQQYADKKQAVDVRWDVSLCLASDLDMFFREYSDSYADMYQNKDTEIEHMAVDLISGRTSVIRMRIASVEQDEHLDDEAQLLLDRISAYEKEYGISAYSIYQLKLSDSTDNLRFMPYYWVQSCGLSVDRDNYVMVYTAERASEDTLEDIFLNLNNGNTANFKGHSLSVSDVVVLHENGVSTAYYVDVIGFKKLPCF